MEFDGPVDWERGPAMRRSAEESAIAGPAGGLWGLWQIGGRDASNAHPGHI
ncbi:hypothetical protein [Marivita sp.]|uniref:hypothetical protein n=1 Tax=Marivita sp. TaxID=2003365 RepID=UPI0025C57F80|nr:hypothetical protein [Marivita sp.]